MAGWPSADLTWRKVAHWYPTRSISVRCSFISNDTHWYRRWCFRERKETSCCMLFALHYFLEHLAGNARISTNDSAVPQTFPIRSINFYYWLAMVGSYCFHTVIGCIPQPGGTSCYYQPRFATKSPRREVMDGHLATCETNCSATNLDAMCIYTWWSINHLNL